MRLKQGLQSASYVHRAATQMPQGLLAVNYVNQGTLRNQTNTDPRYVKFVRKEVLEVLAVVQNASCAAQDSTVT